MENKKKKMIDAYKKHTMEEMTTTNIKNKKSNPIQITAEQIIADPEIHQLQNIEIPTQKYIGDDEISDYKKMRRKKFEDSLRKQRHHIGKWIEYAEWENELQEYRRGRSIFERALDVDPYKISLWIRYAENEMKNKFVIHARNVFERAIKILPRVEQLWFKYIEMEELLSNYKKCILLYNKWMNFLPSKRAWDSYLSFLEKLGEVEKVREVHYKLLDNFPEVRNYIKVAKYEYRKRNIESARFLYEKALEDLGEKCYIQKFFISWADFEIKCGEFERGKEIYIFGLKCLDENNKDWVESEYEKFERVRGEEKNVDDIILLKRRKKYRNIINKNKMNFNAYFDLIFLEESFLNYDNVEKIYEEVLNLHPEEKKKNWERFIYFYLSYAIFLELKKKDKEKAIKIMEKAIKKIPHKKFTFSKIWIYLGKLYIRNNEIDKMRKLLGKSIGICKKEKIIKKYIELEYQMGNFERCRKLYEKKIELFSNKSESWICYAKFEEELNENERVISIYEKALKFDLIEKPEKIWKNYIDFEIRNENYKKVRILYNELILKTEHVKVFISYALFEYSINHFENMRNIFFKGNFLLSKKNLKEERFFLLENFLQCEKKIGNEIFINKIENLMPKKIKKQKKIEICDENGNVLDYKWEEYFDYIFPDDKVKEVGIKIKDIAEKWKKSKDK